jgi:4-diphosphocytidyl-2-C-methyl-D-erythritol kinase
MNRGVKRQAPAKINLGLWVRGRRPDGYHEIETIFVPVPELADELHVELAPDLDQPKLELTGVDVPGRLEDNLCLRAWALLRSDWAERVPPVRMVLEKRIPVGAGLGGGSSDAAACLLAFDELFGLKLGVVGLRLYARMLGADVPFFLDPRPSLACGIGDELEAIDLPDLGRIDVRFLHVHSDTGLAYRNLDLGQCTAGGSLREAVRQPRQHWPKIITNDFEQEVFLRFPELAREKARLYGEGAYFALMSGSGSAVYGLFA